jgi:hypothetical protein
VRRRVGGGARSRGVGRRWFRGGFDAFCNFFSFAGVWAGFARELRLLNPDAVGRFFFVARDVDEGIHGLVTCADT